MEPIEFIHPLALVAEHIIPLIEGKEAVMLCVCNRELRNTYESCIDKKLLLYLRDHTVSDTKLLKCNMSKFIHKNLRQEHFKSPESRLELLMWEDTWLRYNREYFAYKIVVTHNCINYFKAPLVKSRKYEKVTWADFFTWDLGRVQYFNHKFYFNEIKEDSCKEIERVIKSYLWSMNNKIEVVYSKFGL